MFMLGTNHQCSQNLKRKSDYVEVTGHFRFSVPQNPKN